MPSRNTSSYCVRCSPPSVLISHLSSLTSHLSSLTSHLSPLTSHLSSLTSQLSSLTSHLSSLTSHLSSLSSHLSPLTSHLSPLTSHSKAFHFNEPSRSAYWRMHNDLWSLWKPFFEVFVHHSVVGDISKIHYHIRNIREPCSTCL